MDFLQISNETATASKGPKVPDRIMMSLLVSFIAVFLPNGEGNPCACAYPSGSGERRDNIDERGPFLEGDMILNSFHSPTATTSDFVDKSIGRGTTWPNAQLVYMLDPSFQPAQVAVIKEAFADISGKTCVTFRERSPLSDVDFVFIQRGLQESGCWSYVGRIGGKQIINLEDPACMRSGTIAHELLHSLNRLHEHSRFDRDDYIFINYTNIEPGAQGNFKRFSLQDLNTFGVPYDYSSIMHYSAFAFARLPQLPTIIPKQQGVTIGQRVALSQRDAQRINRLYGCS